MREKEVFEKHIKTTANYSKENRVKEHESRVFLSGFPTNERRFTHLGKPKRVKTTQTQGDTVKPRKIAAILACALTLALPGVASAQDTPAPQISGIVYSGNQLTVFGQSLYFEDEQPGDFSVSLEQSTDDSSVSYTYSGMPDPAIGVPYIVSFSEDEIVLRPGVMPSTFNGTVTFTTPRGVSNTFEFSVDAPYCVTNREEVAKLVGGMDTNWTATPSNWLFTSTEPTQLLIPGVGTLVVPGTNLGPFGFTEATIAVYDCTEVLANQLALSN